MSDLCMLGNVLKGGCPPSTARRLQRATALLLVLLAGTSLPLSALGIGLTGTAVAQIASAEGFGPKVQAGGGGCIDVAVPILAWLEIDASLGLLGVSLSDASGGFSYRGFSGGDLCVSVEAFAPIGSWKGFGQLTAGGGLGVAAVVAGYQSTTLYFFYPEIRAEGFLECNPSFLPALGIRLSIPVSVQLRRDVDFSITTGLAMGVRYHFGGAR
jgi:hypothetical protein